MATPLPVVSCGRDPKVAAGIRQMLLPEYDLIHVCDSVEAAKADIPAIILGRTPASASLPGISNPGSGNYGHRPVAILAGCAYSDADITSIREIIARETGDEGEMIPWVKPDMSKTYPPPGPEFAKLMARGTKECLRRAVREGEGREGRVFLF